MRRSVGLLSILVVSAAVNGIAQSSSPASAPAFEVSSIRRNTAGGFITMNAQPNGRFVVNNAPVIDMIRVAYQLQPFQISGAPGWAESDAYDVQANGTPTTIPLTGPGSPVSPTQLMLRQLLADRFRLKLHMEQRDMPIFVLTRAHADGTLGAQLEKLSIDCSTPSAPPAGPPALPKPGERPPCRMFVTPTSIAAGGVPLTQLASMLGQHVGRQVVDRTGLDGLYGFTLEFAREPLGATSPPPGAAPAGNAGNAPSIFTALEEQLGLKLQSDRGPVETLVIDSIERPSEN
jgi:uncharacterized protein (TIGR03435 family)